MHNYDALVSAASNGRLDVVRELLPAEGATARIDEALVYAAWDGHLHVVTELLPIDGAKARIADALVYATSNGHLDVVMELLPIEGAKAEIAEALVSAAGRGHLRIVTELLPIEGATARIAQALFNAASNGHLDVVRELLPVEAATARIADALLDAAENGHLDVVRELLPVEGATARIADALHIAAENGHSHVVRELLPVEGAAAKIADALLDAASNGHLDVVRELLPIAMNHNVIVPSFDQDLAYAVNYNLVQSVECLLEIKKAEALSANYANSNPLLNTSIGERLRDSIRHGAGRLAITYMLAKFRWPDRRQVDDPVVTKVLNDISNLRREYIKCYEGAYSLFNKVPSEVKAIIGAFVGARKNIADYNNEDEALLTLLCANKNHMLFARQAMNYVKAKKLRETASQETAKRETAVGYLPAFAYKHTALAS